MSEHVQEMLSAYLDGELRGSHLHRVEEHLAECQSCREELKSLQALSGLLKDVPAPEFMPQERFVAEVNLRLPRKTPSGTKRKAQDAGWWMIPVGLLAAWALISAVGLFGDVLSTAREFGLLNSAPQWLVPDSSTGAVWSGRLGDVGLLRGDSLEWVERTEAFTRSTLPSLIWQVSIGFLYLGWFAIWWARHTRQERGQLLEG
ncbi:MAG: zf-HC2 domain-containing protein [Chloroflexota bacterium]